MIELNDVTKKYRGHKALDRLTLTLPKGRVIGLVGENGSGKTTLLKLIAGLVTPDSGTAVFSGNEINRRIASNIAYMPDADLFYPYFTGKQLFDFYESQFVDFNRKKAEEIAAFLKINLHLKIKTLSKGNRGRIKLTVTLGREADYYLLDEPFSGLDPMVRDDISKGLIRFTDPTRQTIFLSTHEVKEVEPLLDEIVVLREGRIIAHETVDDIRATHEKDAASWMVSLFREGS